MCFRKGLFIILGLFLLALPAISGVRTIERKIVKYKLDNGITLLILPKPDVPVISFITRAKVGAANETEEYYGIAHILEHMSFKGTRDIGTKDYNRERIAMAKEDSIFSLILEEKDSLRLDTLRKAFEKIKSQAESLVISNEFGEILEREGGVSLNASTGYDGTSYYLRLPSNKLELWMSMESERFISPVLREFYTETQGPIAEERRMSAENYPPGKLYERFLLTAFPKNHPYGHPIIGFMDDILTATRREARDFFHRYYVPSNLILSIVGDVEPREVLRLAKLYWGRIPKREPPPPPKVPEIPKGEKRVELRLKAQPRLLIGYHRPSVKDSNNPVYDVIADYLGRGRTSLLYKSLVKEKKIATYAYASSSVPGDKYSTLFFISVIPAPGHTAEECELAVYKEIEKLKRESIPKEELDKIIKRAKADIFRYLDNDLFTAMLLAYYEDVYGDYRELFRYIERLEEVTPKDIQRVANGLFVKDNRVVGSIITLKEEK